MDGPLFKRSEWVHRWNPRWFTLNGAELAWRNGRGGSRAGSGHGCGSVPLHGAAHCRGLRFAHKGQTVFPFVVILCNGRELQLGALTPELRSQWIHKLEEAANSIVPLHTLCTSTSGCNRGTDADGGPMRPASDATPRAETTAGGTPPGSPPPKTADGLDRCFSLGWYLSVSDITLHAVPPVTAPAGVLPAEPSPASGSAAAAAASGSGSSTGTSGGSGSSAVTATTAAVALCAVRYACSSLEWVAHRTFADLVEFDLTFRRWMMQHASCSSSGIGDGGSVHGEDDEEEEDEQENDEGVVVDGGGGGSGSRGGTHGGVSGDARHARFARCRRGHSAAVHSLPQLPDIELLFPEFVQEGHRGFLSAATNKLLCHSPRNPVDAGTLVLLPPSVNGLRGGSAGWWDAPAASATADADAETDGGGSRKSSWGSGGDNVGAPPASSSRHARDAARAFVAARPLLLAELGAYFDRVVQIPCFHDFMVRTGSQVCDHAS